MNYPSILSDIQRNPSRNAPKAFQESKETITFNKEDTGELPRSSADVVCLVYAVDDIDTFEHVSTLIDRML